MSFTTAVGLSETVANSFNAGVEAARAALEKLEGGDPDAIMIVSSVVFDIPEALRGIAETIPGVPMVGSSSAGNITADGVHEGSLAVLLLKSDVMKFHPVRVENISENMEAAGKQFGEAVNTVTDNDPRLSFIFSDALAGNGTALVRGVLSVLGGNFPLVGGASADDMQFKKTFQFYNGEVTNNSVVGLAISGDVRYAVGANHGWQPIGNQRMVTKADGQTVYELDGKPAFELYKDYFGDRAKEFKNALSLAAVSYPMGMQVEGNESYMIRVPLKVNEEDGSIVCGAEVMEGSKISLMIGTSSSAMWAAETTTEELAKATIGVKPRLIFISDCVARKVLYGERLHEEVDTIKRIVGVDTNIFGFYSYGQIAPLHYKVKDVATCDPGFYEQSISITMFGE